MLYKTITANTQVSTQECYLMGVELSHTSNTDLKIYDIKDTTAVAANLVSTPRVTTYNRQSSIMFPYPGIKCSGLWADWTAGVGTVYFRYGS